MQVCVKPRFLAASGKDWVHLSTAASCGGRVWFFPHRKIFTLWRPKRAIHKNKKSSLLSATRLLPTPSSPNSHNFSTSCQSFSQKPPPAMSEIVHPTIKGKLVKLPRRACLAARQRLFFCSCKALCCVRSAPANQKHFDEPTCLRSIDRVLPASATATLCFIFTFFLLSPR